jgi:hypothetical protein
MEFKLNLNTRNVPEQELLDDLLRVQGILDSPIAKSKYNELGKFSSGTIERRFGTWNKALEQAGIEINQERNLSDEELFKNLEDVWIKLGRQPKYDEIKQPFSKYSMMPYHRRFGKWNDALHSFVNYINSDISEQQVELEEIQNEPKDISNVIKHKTKREISDRLRFRILMRDGFTCKSCGKSPIREMGVELHIDHIIPWSKGGETISENLVTKCQQCNLGKGNAFDV